MTSPRSALIAAAQQLVGCSGDMYAAVVAAPELAAGLPGRAAEVAAMSGCGLVYLALVRGVWGLPGELYRTGQAFADVYRLAGGRDGQAWRPAGACRAATLEAPPQPGDGIVWGASAGAVAHVDACVVDDALHIGGPVLTLGVVAGGQRSAEGDETVALLSRVLRWQAGGWQDTANGRRVLAVLDADALGTLYGAPITS